MEKLSLKGFYEYERIPSGKGNFKGEICLKQDNSFEGRVHDDASRSPDQRINGRVIIENNLEKMYFFKFPPDEFLLPLFYELEKEKVSSWQGTYNGKWRVMPYGIKFSEDLGLYMPDANNPNRIDPFLIDFGEKAQITLYKSKK
jgi:hypothetical protein